MMLLGGYSISHLPNAYIYIYIYIYLDTIFYTGAPTGQEETFPHEEYDMPRPSRKHTISDISDLVSYPKRGNHNTSEHVR